MIALVVGLVGCDHATKHWAEAQLRDAPAMQVVPRVLDLDYTQNHDVAFNLLRWIPRDVRRPILLGLAAVMIPIMALWWRRHARTRTEHIAFGVVFAGALGNVIDRIARGYVVDFIHVHHWPVFNVADICVVAGALLLLLLPALRARPAPSG
jgi:signal peptidase II